MTTRYSLRKFTARQAVFIAAVCSGLSSLFFGHVALADPAASGSPSPQQWAIGDTKITLKLSIPAATKPEKEEKLPTIDITGVADVKVVLRKGVVWGTPEEIDSSVNRIIGVCALAPGSAWSPGADDLVFAKMNAMLRDELTKRGPVEAFDDSTNGETSTLFFQHVHAHTAAVTGKPSIQLDAQHFVGFVGEKSDVVACSAVCTEKASDAPQCATIAKQAALVGPLVQPPKGSFSARLSIGLARNPGAAAGFVIGCLVALAGLVVLALTLRSPAVVTDEDPDS